MGVETETGYTWTDGKFARLLHEGNRHPIKTVTATKDSGSTASLVDNDLTIDKWIPFANLIAEPTNFSAADWTATNLTVSSDGQTVTETTANGAHDLEADVTWDSAGAQAVFAIQVERRTLSEVRLLANDGTNTRTCWFDLRDLTVGTAVNSTGQIIDLGDGVYELRMYFTANSAAGRVEIQFGNGSEGTSYVGNTDTVLKILRAAAHTGEASLRLDTFTGLGATCFAIGAHNLGSAGARITFEHDSNSDDTFTAIETVTPTNDSPILFFFDTVTSSRWRITVDRGVLPEIAVVRVGNPLTFERPFYSGFTPARMGRATDVIGNISRTGELLGRSIKRTLLQEDYQWKNLTYTWVRANIDKPGGVIQSLEKKAAFMAWRPEEATDDVSYILRAQPTAPRAQGSRDLWTFSFSAEVYAYE